jgi:hypothetical protein
MTNLEQLAGLLFDAIVNLDPQEFDAIADAVTRLKTEDQASYSALMHGGCTEFATLFGAVEQAAFGLEITDPISPGTRRQSAEPAGPARKIPNGNIGRRKTNLALNRSCSRESTPFSN